MTSTSDRVRKMVYTKSFAAGVLLAVGLMILSAIYSTSAQVNVSGQTLALLLFMAGLYSGYYLGTSIRTGGESTYFLVGVTLPIVTVVFASSVLTQTLAASLLPIALAFSVVFVNSGTMADQKNYVRFIGSFSKHVSQFVVLTFVLLAFVSPVLQGAINVSLGVELSGAIALALTAGEKFIRSRLNGQ